MIDGILYLYPRSISTVETRRCISELTVEIIAAVTVMNNIVDNHSGYPVDPRRYDFPNVTRPSDCIRTAINHAFELAVTRKEETRDDKKRNDQSIPRNFLKRLLVFSPT